MVSKDCQIAHTGRVAGLSDNVYLVEIIPEVSHDCGGCAISQFCSGSGGQRMTVRAVADDRIATPAIGDRVKIVAGTGMRTEAAILLLVVPLVVMLIVALALSLLGLSDLVTGISSVASAALSYFFIHHALRRKTPKWVMVKIVN